MPQHRVFRPAVGAAASRLLHPRLHCITLFMPMTIPITSTLSTSAQTSGYTFQTGCQPPNAPCQTHERRLQPPPNHEIAKRHPKAFEH